MKMAGEQKHGKGKWTQENAKIGRYTECEPRFPQIYFRVQETPEEKKSWLKERVA